MERNNSVYSTHAVPHALTSETGRAAVVRPGGRCGCAMGAGPSSPAIRACPSSNFTTTQGFVTWYGDAALTGAGAGRAMLSATANLVLSIHAFTCRLVIVVGVARGSAERRALQAQLSRAMPASRFPRLILTVIKAVRISRRFPGDYHAYKLQAILESGLEEGGVYVDSDAVVTPFAPRLFEVLQAAEGDTLPLLPLHPCDPDNWAPLMRHLAAAPGSSDAVTTPTTPYLHADVIVFPAAALGFLREALAAAD